MNVKDCKPPKKIGRGYVDENNVYHGALFFKLQIGNKTFFAKKHTTVEKYEEQELKNISLVYNTIPREKLITYYGISKRYGLIYEWLNKFEYVGKTDLVMGNKKLHDVDVIKIKGQTKYIDFVS